LLSSLLNEPIEGQGIFWSSTGRTKYPIPLRVLSFEQMYAVADPRNNRAAIQTYASQLRAQLGEAFGVVAAASTQARTKEASPEPETADIELQELQQLERSDFDMLKSLENRAIQKLRDDAVVQKSRGFAIPWGVVLGRLRDALPIQLDGRDEIAFRLVVRAVNEIVGPQGSAWHTERKGPKSTTFIVVD